jgi:hypothetical protein
MKGKMITYVLTLSKVFPSYHYRAGEPTEFEAAFNAGQDTPKGDTFAKYMKLHTIRANYDFWAKRFEKIAAGEAVLSIRQWTGKPYRSKQREIVRLTREDGIGLQKMTIVGCSTIHPIYIDTHSVRAKDLAHNDGLSEVDWRNWFEKYDLTEPLAVIHFTKFRYLRGGMYR